MIQQDEVSLSLQKLNTIATAKIYLKREDVKQRTKTHAPPTQKKEVVVFILLISKLEEFLKF